MGFKIKITIVLALFLYKSWAQDAAIEERFSGRCSNLTVYETLDYISSLTRARFAYSSLSIDENLKVSFGFENVTLTGLLEKLHEHTGLKSTVFGNQVLLKREIIKSKNFVIAGSIVEQDSITPVSYATVSVTGKQIGAVSDLHGKFELELKDENLSDTLLFSFMGYEPVKMSVSNYRQLKESIIILKVIFFDVPPARISTRDFKKVNIGNSKNIPSGSLYMDTNGQQSALLVENDKNAEGIILTLNYYLSSNGNTDAPFRVRLYSVDTISGGPGVDLIKEMIVVKPDIKKGWYSINIRKFDIKVPENGFFIAMEGVFPNEFDFYTGDDGFIDLSGGDQVAENDVPASIIYGQRLGYSRNKKDKNNTWHYSLSHTWFQLKKQPFGILVSADILIRKNKRH